jgi:hypothetical protein
MKCNPNKNRREVLEKYASYLENLYPRRCCDIDEEITYGIPVPKINQLRSYCPICRDTYETDEKTNNEEDKTANNVNINNNMIEIQQNNKIKITSRIVGRSLKPVRGLFHGVPKGKIFLHACDEAARDTSIRNCGPGYILRRVMQQIPSQIMDLPFILSEDTDVE